MAEKEEAGGAVTTRWMELITALVIVALGLLVVYDSHRVGAGWAEDGPRSGYFPNIIGWILTAAGAWIAGSTIVRWRKLAGNVFVSFANLKPVLITGFPLLYLYLFGVWTAGIVAVFVLVRRA